MLRLDPRVRVQEVVCLYGRSKARWTKGKEADKRNRQISGHKCGSKGWLCASGFNCDIDWYTSLFLKIPCCKSATSRSFVLVFFATGTPSSTSQQQLLVCTSQATQLITGMGKAINSVTHLTLAIDHHQPSQLQERATNITFQGQVHDKQRYRRDHNLSAHLPSAASSSIERLRRNAKLTTSAWPDTFWTTTNAVFAMLAAAMPNLTHLSLRGAIYDAALKTFGACCPELASLCIEAITLPVQALQNLSESLPHLTAITVKGNNVNERDEQQLCAYMDALFLAIQHCSLVAALYLFPPVYVDLTLKCEQWRRLPASLRHLECLYNVHETCSWEDLLCRVPSLSLRHTPRDDLVGLLDDFPLLTRLQALQPELAYLELCCDEDEYTEVDSNLRQRLLGGSLSLECYAMGLEGTSAEVRDVLSWLPPFHAVQRVILDLEDDAEWSGSQVYCMGHFPRVFPNATWLTMTGSEEWAATWQAEVAFFEPITSTLETLHIDKKVKSLTTAGLTQLCSSLVKLTELHLEPCRNVDLRQLEAALKKMGRKIFLLCDDSDIQWQ